MNVIRIYDDRFVFLDCSFRSKDELNTPPIDIVKKLKKYCARIEYCTISEGHYIMFCLEAGKAVTEKPSWELEPGNDYYAFLDTLWGSQRLPDEKGHIQFGSILYPMELSKNLTDPRVKSLTVYTAFDPDAANGLLSELKKYKDLCAKKRIYFPRIENDTQHIIYDDREKIVKVLKRPLSGRTIAR